MRVMPVASLERALRVGRVSSRRRGGLHNGVSTSGSARFEHEDVVDLGLELPRTHLMGVAQSLLFSPSRVAGRPGDADRAMRRRRPGPAAQASAPLDKGISANRAEARQGLDSAAAPTSNEDDPNASNDTSGAFMGVLANSTALECELTFDFDPENPGCEGNEGGVAGCIEGG